MAGSQGGLSCRHFACEQAEDVSDATNRLIPARNAAWQRQMRRIIAGTETHKIRLIMPIVRWLLTVPSALVGFYAGALVAILILESGKSLCPEADMVSGMCVAPWIWYVDQGAFGFGSLLCGAFVVLLPTLMAPAHRRIVALAFYGLGLASAALLWVPAMWTMNLAAAVGGAIAVWRIHVVLARKA
jgi:hypothetical protein